MHYNRCSGQPGLHALLMQLHLLHILLQMNLGHKLLNSETVHIVTAPLDWMCRQQCHAQIGAVMFIRSIHPPANYTDDGSLKKTFKLFTA